MASQKMGSKDFEYELGGTVTFSGTVVQTGASTIAADNTYSGDMTFSGTNTLTGINTFSGANVHTGIETFSGGMRSQLVYTLDLVDDDSNWTEELNGSFDKADLTEGPLLNDGAMSMTQTDATGGKQIYFEPTLTADLSGFTTMGMWYKGGNNDAIATDDVKILLFQGGLTATASASDELSFPAFTEAAAAEWKYTELTLSTDTTTRAAVTRIGFLSEAGTNANEIDVANIEFFNYSTGSGPAYGEIHTGIIDSADVIAQGDILEFKGNGRVGDVTDNTPQFAGVSVTPGTVTGDGVGSVTVNYVTTGFVNLQTDEILTAGDGVAADGTTNGIDDGGANSEAIQFGMVPHTAIAEDLVAVLIGSRGFVGTVGT